MSPWGTMRWRTTAAESRSSIPGVPDKQFQISNGGGEREVQEGITGKQIAAPMNAPSLRKRCIARDEVINPCTDTFNEHRLQRLTCKYKQLVCYVLYLLFSSTFRPSPSGQTASNFWPDPDANPIYFTRHSTRNDEAKGSTPLRWRKMKSGQVSSQQTWFGRGDILQEYTCRNSIHKYFPVSQISWTLKENNYNENIIKTIKRNGAKKTRAVMFLILLSLPPPPICVREDSGRIILNY